MQPDCTKAFTFFFESCLNIPQIERYLSKQINKHF